MSKKNGYNKLEIERLFKEYIKNGDDSTFASLIEECAPMIDIVLTNYGKYSRHFEDIRQEVKFRLWKNLRIPKRLKNYLRSPPTYLFFIIRTYVAEACKRFIRIYGDDREVFNIADYEYLLGYPIYNTFLDPESDYILRKELPNTLFDRIVGKLIDDISFRKCSMEVQREVLAKYRKEVEELFGVELNDN